MSQNLFSQLLVNLASRQQAVEEEKRSPYDLPDALGSALMSGTIPGMDHGESGNYPQFLFQRVLTFFQAETLQVLCKNEVLLDLLDNIIQQQPNHLFAHELSILLHRYAVRVLLAQQDCESLQRARSSLQSQIQRFQEDAKSKCFDKDNIVQLVNQKFGERRDGLAKRQLTICRHVSGAFKGAITKAQLLAEHYPLIGHFRLAMIYKQWREFPLNDDLTHSRCNKHYTLCLEKVMEAAKDNEKLPLLSIEDEDYSDLLAACMENCAYPSSSWQTFTTFLELEAEQAKSEIKAYSYAQSNGQDCHSLLDNIIKQGCEHTIASNSLLRDLIDALKLLEVRNIQGDLPADNVTQLKNLLTSWQSQLENFFIKQGIRLA